MLLEVAGRWLSESRPCRRCQGAPILPGMSCPGCGFSARAYRLRQARRIAGGAAVGLVAGALGSRWAVGHVDGGAVFWAAYLCGVLAGVAYSAAAKGPGPC